MHSSCIYIAFIRTQTYVYRYIDYIYYSLRNPYSNDVNFLRNYLLTAFSNLDQFFHFIIFVKMYAITTSSYYTLQKKESETCKLINTCQLK